MSHWNTWSRSIEISKMLKYERIWSDVYLYNEMSVNPNTHVNLHGKDIVYHAKGRGAGWKSAVK